MAFIEIKPLLEYPINLESETLNEELELVNKFNIYITEFKRKDYKPKYKIKPFSNGYNKFTEINTFINKYRPPIEPPQKDIQTISPAKKIDYSTPGILRRKIIRKRKKQILPITDIYNELNKEEIPNLDSLYCIDDLINEFFDDY